MLDFHKSVCYFVQHNESCNYTSVFKQRPFKFIQHLCNAGGPGVVVTTHSGCISLDTFYLFVFLISEGRPTTDTIFKFWVDKRLVELRCNLVATGFEVPSDDQ